MLARDGYLPRRSDARTGPGALARYGLAVAAAVVAIALRVLLAGKIVGTFVLAYPPVFVAAAVGGLGPGILATILTALLAWYWVIPPRGQFAPLSPQETVGFLVFVLMGVLMSAMAEALRRSRRQAAELEAERALRLSEERQRSVIAAMSEGVVVHDATGAITLCNDAALRILGLTRDELTGRTSLDPRWSTVHEDGSPFPGDEHPATVTLRTGRPAHGVAMGVKKPDGSLSWIEINTEPVRGASGTVTSVVATFADVTARKRAEEALRESERRLALVVENAREGITLLDVRSGRFVLVSPSLATMTGFTQEELLAMSLEEVRDRCHPDDRARLAQQEATVATQDPLGPVEYRWKVKSGEYRWFASNRKLVCDASGRPVATVGVTRDITSRRRAEQTLARSEKRYRQLVEMLPDGVVVVRRGAVEEANPAAVRLLGARSADQVLGLTRYDVLSPEDVRASAEQQARAREGRSTHPTFLHLRGRDGILREVEAVGHPLEDPGGNAFVVVLRDLADRRRLEREREAALRLLNQHLGNTPLGIIEWDGDFRVTSFGGRAEAIFGWKAAEVVGKRIDEVPWVPEEDWPKVGAVMEGMATGTLPVNVNANRNVRKDGRVISCEWFNSAIRDERGRLRSVFSLVQDVTEREEARRALAWSEHRYRTLLEVAPIPLFVFRGDRIEAANPAGLALAGATRPDQIVGHGIEEFLAPAERARAAELFAGLAAGQVVGPAEFQVTRVNGEPQIVEVAAAPFTDERGVAYHFAERDVTEQRRAEQALAASEARFRALADQAPLGVVEIALDGSRLLYVNTEAAAIAGRTREEMLRAPLGEEIHPDDRERVRKAFAETASGVGKHTVEFRVRRPDGSDRLVRMDGVLLRDATGRPNSHLGLEVDVTEVRAAQRALAVRTRLEAMGTLVAGVGHEINNPLAGMMAGEGYVLDVVKQLLVRLRSPRPPSPAEVADELEESVNALGDGLASGERIARIVKDLALFGRATDTRERVRLRDVVDIGLRWLPGPIRDAAHVEVVDERAPDLVGLPGQLSQMVLNLVSNACRSGTEGQRPHVLVRIGHGAPGKACLEVVDDGAGMSPETVRRIFDPFFTTRPSGEHRGAGLGLSLCHAIVGAHGGTITVESEPGKGSTFRVELPAAV